MSVRKRTWKAGDEIKSAWVADYFDQEGKRRRKTFPTKKTADAWLVETRHDIGLGVHTATRASITIAEAGDLWLAQGESDGLERSTLTAYRSHLSLHIKPLIGAVRLADFTPAAVPAFRNKLLAEGRSPAVTRKVLVSLGTLIANAMAIGKVARNVVRDQGRNTQRQNRLAKRHAKQLEVGEDIPSKDEIRALLAHAEGRARVVLVVLVFTGLRASELRGLRWRDVDLKGGELVVRQRADQWRLIGSPKSAAARRTVPLAPIVVNTLREWRLACPHKADTDLVFANKNGRPFAHPQILYGDLGPAQEAAGITDPATNRFARPDSKGDRRTKYGMHAFRHAAASLFIEQGFSPKRVQALMGHSSIQMTFDTYGHLFPSPADDQAAMRQLQARLIGA